MSPFPVLATALRERTLQLKTCKLTYAVWGCLHSEHVCIFQHGWPGSRLGGSMLHEVGVALGLRIISVDRPGFGGSPPDPHHNLASWAHRLEELADRLRVKQFSLLGVSGGAPFAAACARYLPPGRLLGLGLVCPMGPLDVSRAGTALPSRLLLALARRWPAAAKAAWRVSRRLLQLDPAALTRWALNSRDRAAMVGAPAAAAAIRTAVLEGLAQGPSAVVHEMGLVQRPWGFQLRDIQVPHVLMWHGLEDPVAPASLAAAYEAIPGCEAHYFPGDTHTTLVVQRLEQALEALAAAAHGCTTNSSSSSSSRQEVLQGVLLPQDIAPVLQHQQQPLEVLPPPPPPLPAAAAAAATSPEVLLPHLLQPWQQQQQQQVPQPSEPQQSPGQLSRHTLPWLPLPELLVPLQELPAARAALCQAGCGGGGPDGSRGAVAVTASSG